MPNTLDWVGDGDDISAVRDIEEIFEIAFSPAELVAMQTVGDLQDLVLAKLPADRDMGKCATAMAFYRLRRALNAREPNVRITPATDMAAFRAPWIRQFFRDLERQTGLSLGGPAHTWIGSLGWTLVLLPLMLVLPTLLVSVFASVSPWFWAALIVMFAAGILLLRFDPGRLTGTVGDLVRKAADRNYGRLMKQGAKGRDAEIWRLLTETLAHESRLKPDTITRETVFFRSQLEAA